MNVLETERLIISHVSAQNAEFMLQLLNSPSWIKYIGDRNVKTAEEAAKYIEQRVMSSYKKNGFGFYLVSTKDKTPAGICGLVKRENLEDVDIGFAFLPEFEGKGYGYESAAAMLRHAMETLQLNRIIAITNKENTRSVKLLEKIGLSFEKMIDYNGEELMLLAIEKS